VTQQKAGIQGPWLYDRRVRWLLEQSIDEGEQVRFGIEGMDGQCIIALDERLLVIKPGFVRGTDFGGLAASISYADITSIETNVAASNSVVQAAFQGCYCCCCCCCCCCRLSISAHIKSPACRNIPITSSCAGALSSIVLCTLLMWSTACPSAC
jgi:hypothetical protein